MRFLENLPEDPKEHAEFLTLLNKTVKHIITKK